MTSTRTPSARLIVENLANATAMLGGGVRSVLPFARSRSEGELSQTMKGPSARLLDAYNQWTGMDMARFGDSLPPHFAASNMALAMISKLTARAPYPLLSVLNQGVSLRINQPLPCTGPYLLRGNLVDASDDGYRARIHSHICFGTQANPEALLIDAYAAVVLKSRPGKQGKKAEEPAFTRIGQWQGAANEGVNFFKLTGDFNPIHTLEPFARRTSFGGCIMHGYGAFAQTFEIIRNQGMDIAEIDVRFVRPVPLPSPVIDIQISEQANEQGRHAFRLIDEQQNVYHAGEFLPRGSKV